MFEDSLIESTGQIHTRSRRYAAGSLIFQATLVGVLAADEGLMHHLRQGGGGILPRMPGRPLAIVKVFLNADTGYYQRKRKANC